ncbi:MAG: hypothetical protein HYZ27_12375 [Deltaproteobacteria bacterium]|nr:hypothetical protein [Deltaproteobacteria bacterium]
MAASRRNAVPRGTADQVASFHEDGDTAETAALDPAPPIAPEGEQPDFAAPTLADPELLALVKLGLQNGPTVSDGDDTDASLRIPRHDTDEHPLSSDPTLSTPALHIESGEVPVFGDPTIATPAIHAEMAAYLKAPQLRKPEPRPSEPRPSFDDPTHLDPSAFADLHRPDFAGPTLAGAVMYESPAKTDEDLPAQTEPAPTHDPSLRLSAIRRSAIPVTAAPPPPRPSESPAASKYRMHVLREPNAERRSVPPPGPPQKLRPSGAQKLQKSKTPTLVAVMISIIAVLIVGIAIAVALR